MTKVVPFIGPFSQRRFVIVDYFVCDEEFFIKVNYDKDQFEYLIKEYVCEILEELKKSKSHRYCWVVHSPLCEDMQVPDNYFLQSVVITIQRE